MKVYRIPAGTYFEKQEDARKADRAFEPVEFPFAASPKAEFVDWLNSTPVRVAELVSGMSAEQALAPSPLLQELPFKPVPQPLPTQPDAAHAARSIAFEDAFAGFPLALKLHYAGLALEDAREKIK